VNSNDAYTAEIRAFDKSMLGVFGIFTPVSAEVGVNRSLVLNPRITDELGRFQEKSLEELTMENMFAPGELLNGFTANHADPMRICMATTQGKHIMPTVVQHNYLFGTGIDKTLSKLIGQDFAFKAVDDGAVDKIDEKQGLIFLKYKDGTTSAIDITDKPSKNSASGFYIRNKLDQYDYVKPGYKFKKGEILARNQAFFKEDMDESVGFAPGRLTKVALMCLPKTYEDSIPITERVAEEMASEVITEKQVALKVNSKIYQIVKKGQKIGVGEPLIIFEEIGDTAKSALDAVERLSKEAEGTDLEHIGRNVIKSKYSGVITDVRVYYNCNLESEKMEPSLKGFVEDYINVHRKRANALNGTRPDEMIPVPSTERVDSDKILGVEMQGVLICFYVSHVEPLDIGAKVTMFSACKGVVSEVIPDELAPRSEFNEHEPIEAILSPMSVISRNVPDLLMTGWCNKALLGLKQSVLEDLSEVLQLKK
jgi:hypothetical protein